MELFTLLGTSHVHSGGQAVVGMVETPGGGDRAKLEDQPDAKPDAERPVPDARWDVPGRAEG
jgi:hypothetical protein